MKRLFCALLALVSILALASSCSEKTPKDPEYVKHISASSTNPLGDILKNYKGKVTLVNLWASWCGPCKQAHEILEPMKDDALKDVQFVYVSSPTSPEETWREMIPDIRGDHYYITSEQMSTILNELDSQAYPTFVIIGKDGSILHKYIGYSNEIPSALKKALE